jgi:prefoldin subunit 5
MVIFLTKKKLDNYISKQIDEQTKSLKERLEKLEANLKRKNKELNANKSIIDEWVYGKDSTDK